MKGACWSKRRKLRSKNIYSALVADMNSRLRDNELRELKWQQIDLVHKPPLPAQSDSPEFRHDGRQRVELRLRRRVHARGSAFSK